jgi:hypothetical protein
MVVNWHRINDWLVDDVNDMMNNNKEHEANITLNGIRTGNGDGARKLSDSDNTVSRSFGITDLWSIRRNTRTFRIHNRIPRL